MTLEPVDAPEDACRVVVENRTRRVLGVRDDLGGHRFRLVTLFQPADGGRLLVEIDQCHGATRPTPGDAIVHIVEAPYPASTTGARRDATGVWQWSLLLRNLPLERGGCTVRISGADLPECRDYDLVPLDAYWAGYLLGTSAD
ncbi:hypothetical protein [Actinokineospora sp. UTMC 2448]|uniref:hypothetical protein n=1 Tax=Actinokineospora sp. UTMC 2448 TaxID=2268449 RepID=UPI0021649CF7|nr:hypothetical protein [Actinokineospora sp. UTMC 2448]UVS80269.1 hypothetical protein Actkin_04019 [Actinokineospora sp. UTMC 2448]